MRRLVSLFFLLASCSSSSFSIAPGGDASVIDSGAGDAAGDDSSVTDGVVTDDASDASDASDGGCVDKGFCADKCGGGLVDACGKARDCATDCGLDKTCDTGTHTCVCLSVPIDTWCINRCGVNKDNCGKDVDCGACSTGATCAAGSCGCTPKADAAVCKDAGVACGETKNNCSQTISCGVCTATQNCVGGKCCDAKAITCAGKCGTVVNGCGTSVDCGGCGLGLTCCKNACANTLTDVANCGSCNASCGTIPNADKCEGGGCTCTGHGLNTDAHSCGPCSGGTSMDCSKGGRSRCTAGICF